MSKEYLKAKPDDFKIDDEWFRLMPMLSPEDSQAMEESIKQDGVREPIAVLPDMTILDGHQRWTLVKYHPDFPQEIPYEYVALSSREDIIDFIILRNLRRRHLTSWQKKNVFTTVMERLVEQGKGRKMDNLKQGDKAPEVDVSSQKFEQFRDGRRSRTVIAEKYGIPEETQKLDKVLRDSEDWKTMAMLDRGEITQAEAWRRVRKDIGKKGKAKKKTHTFLMDRSLNFRDFIVVATSIMRTIWELTRGDDAIRLRMDAVDKKEADIVDSDSEKSWKPIPFQGWTCVHDVVGGCWRCYPELMDSGHRKKTSVHKADSISIPVDRKELGSFTVLADPDFAGCRKCDLFDLINDRCGWEEGTEVPEGCKKYKHRR